MLPIMDIDHLLILRLSARLVVIYFKSSEVNNPSAFFLMPFDMSPLHLTNGKKSEMAGCSDRFTPQRGESGDASTRQDFYVHSFPIFRKGMT